LPDYPEHGCTFDQIAKKNCNQYVGRELQLAVLFLDLRHAVFNSGAVDHPALLCAYAPCVSWIPAGVVALRTDPISVSGLYSQPLGRGGIESYSPPEREKSPSKIRGYAWNHLIVGIVGNQEDIRMTREVIRGVGANAYVGREFRKRRRRQVNFVHLLDVFEFHFCGLV
jgi:hypothetical protein